MGSASMRKWVRRVIRSRRQAGKTIGPPNGVYVAALHTRLRERRRRRFWAAVADVFGPEKATRWEGPRRLVEHILG